MKKKQAENLPYLHYSTNETKNERKERTNKRGTVTQNEDFWYDGQECP